MNLYKISRKTGRAGYDEYKGAIVAAKSSDDARSIHPGSAIYPNIKEAEDWTTLDNIQVEYIGGAASYLEQGVVLESFRAG